MVFLFRSMGRYTEDENSQSNTDAGSHDYLLGKQLVTDTRSKLDREAAFSSKHATEEGRKTRRKIHGNKNFSKPLLTEGSLLYHLTHLVNAYKTEIVSTYGILVAAPVGHIVCALALLNSDAVHIADKSAFLAGTNFPDIRYIGKIGRSVTHKMEGEGLSYVLSATSAFEAGRRYHVFVDREREKHMQKHDAYRFFKNDPLKTQMLKIVEDHILFEQIKGKIDAKEIFGKIRAEERSYLVPVATLDTWHRLLVTYLDQTHWFNVVRYFKTLREFQRALGMPTDFFGDVWTSLRTLGFFIYAYFQVEKLSRDKELRAIILDFYENKIKEIIKSGTLPTDERTVELRSHDPPQPIKMVRALV